MKNKINGIGAMFVLVFAFAVSGSIAHASSTNILVGQDLTIGSTNENVVVLQGLLSELGYLNIPQGIPLGYYGGITKSALARYQTNLSVAPAVGYFGPVTKVAIHDDFASHGYLKILSW